MDDEVIKLHLQHTEESIARIAEMTETGFATIGARQSASDTRMNSLEKDVSAIAISQSAIVVAVEKLKSNPILQYSAGTLGGGGILGLLFYIQQSAGGVIP